MSKRLVMLATGVIALTSWGYGCTNASTNTAVNLDPSQQITLYFDGLPQVFNINDIAVSLALLLNPSASIQQIQQVGSDIFGVSLSLNDITGAGPNPLANFDLNQDGDRGNIEDFGVALAVLLGATDAVSANAICLDLLNLDCVSLGVAIPGTGATPFPPSANTFFVATNGNDETGDGSQMNPWATITFALDDNVPDGSLILVRPGTYMGRQRIVGRFAQGVTVRSEVPYQAQMRANEAVFTIFNAEGITLEGFDVSHIGPGAEPIVVQIQSADFPEITRRITLRNNIIHDSFNNDLIKVGGFGVEELQIVGNIFYNQGESDEHIDVNSSTDVLIADNIFFNDFEGSGRPVDLEASSFIVVKDSNGDEDGVVGSDRVTIQRNIFLNYQGSPGSNFVLIGEDGMPYFEANNVLIENNLMLGNSSIPMRAPFGSKGVNAVTFRNNTVVGDLPSNAFAFRLNVEGDNLPNANIQFFNNIWSDPTGTMEDFSDTPFGETSSFMLSNNAYWNGGMPIPTDPEDLINIDNDLSAIVGNPELPAQNGVVLPRLNGGQLADGSVRQAFERLVMEFGIPGNGVVDRADPAQSPMDDILGRSRGGSPDVGAVEVGSGGGSPSPSMEPSMTPSMAPSMTPSPVTPPPGSGIVVTNINDAGAGSLRAAITEATDNGPGFDLITFAPNVTGTITLASTLQIESSLRIQGPGANQLAISGNNTLPVLTVSETVTLQGLTITKGMAESGGGGLFNFGNLTLEDCVFSNNKAAAIGAAIFNDESSKGLTISNTTFTNNSSGGDGGAIASQKSMVIENSTFSGNSAVNVGGAILSDPPAITLRDNRFSGNMAQNSGGAVAIFNFRSGTAPVLINNIFENNSSPMGSQNGNILNGTTLTVTGSGNTPATCNNLPPEIGGC